MRDIDLAVRARRVRRHRRPDRLRQVHAAQRGGRPAGALRGAVRIFGAPLAGLNRRAGYLFQQDAVMPWKTARDNVAIGLEIGRRVRAAKRCERARRGSSASGCRFRRPLSAPALGRAAEARRPGPGADPRSRDPAHGRAVRAARRADARRSWATCCSSCGPATARPCCSSPTTSRRRSRWPTAW